MTDDDLRARVQTDRMPQMDPAEEGTAVNHADADLQFFDTSGLDEPDRSVTEAYRELARSLTYLPRNKHRARATERLLESLDAARRALLYRPIP